jgi:aminomethyltransferase
MPVRTPPLREQHADAGATFTEFGGWDMPVEFDSIQTEHAAVRESVGRFDVSHMGELLIEGPDAGALTQRLTTNDVAALERGQAQYAGITNEDGHLIDDTIVYNLPEAWGEGYLIIPNAGNDESVQAWCERHADTWDLEVTVDNRTEEYALFAIQGPDAMGLADGVAESDMGDLGRFRTTVGAIAGTDCLISRTGYTGEDGVEVLCPAEGAAPVWSAFDCQRCGLGARDTLRIEMGFLLSGQDFDVEENPRTPFEAGIGFVVDLDTEFLGRDALAEQSERSVGESFRGLRLLDRGVPRHGHEIVNENNHIVGTVTSGTMSPTLDEPIALGYLPEEYAEVGTTLGVSIRGNRKTATVTEPPFLEGY